MAKTFYTEKEIEDMFRGGVMSLELGDDVVLTELAYEKANSIGMRLVCNRPDNPPCAPIRPYISMKQGRPAAPTRSLGNDRPRVSDDGIASAQIDGPSLPERIRNAVAARLGNQVDANLLDVIIKRVLNSTGVKEPVCCSAESGAQRCAPSNTAAPRG
jgi:hypothetical protein